MAATAAEAGLVDVRTRAPGIALDIDTPRDLAAFARYGVDRVVPVAADVLDAQLAALAADMRPSVIKTGLIGSAEGVAVLMRWLVVALLHRLSSLVPIRLSPSGCLFTVISVRLAPCLKPSW